MIYEADSNAYTPRKAFVLRLPLSMRTQRQALSTRTLCRSGRILSSLVANADADGNARVHFIPVYVEDGNYTVSATATHIWTPAGMISAVRNVNVVIDGTIYDDWYQG